MGDSHLGLEESGQKIYEVNFRENISSWVLLCVEVSVQIAFPRAQKVTLGPRYQCCVASTRSSSTSVWKTQKLHLAYPLFLLPGANMDGLCSIELEHSMFAARYMICTGYWYVSSAIPLRASWHDLYPTPVKYAVVISSKYHDQYVNSDVKKILSSSIVGPRYQLSCEHLELL